MGHHEYETLSLLTVFCAVVLSRVSFLDSMLHWTMFRTCINCLKLFCRLRSSAWPLERCQMLHSSRTFCCPWYRVCLIPWVDFCEYRQSVYYRGRQVFWTR